MKKENLQKNQLLQRDSQFVRILEFNGDKVFIIDCRKKTMPVWTDVEVLKDNTVDFVSFSYYSSRVSSSNLEKAKQSESITKEYRHFCNRPCRIRCREQKDRLRKIYNDCSGVTICG